MSNTLKAFAILTLAWPLYWLEPEAAKAQYLTGAARATGITEIAKSCMDAHGTGNSGMLPRPYAEKYCQCYAEGLVDHLPADEFKDAVSPTANAAIDREGKRCYQIIRNEALQNVGHN